MFAAGGYEQMLNARIWQNCDILMHVYGIKLLMFAFFPDLKLNLNFKSQAWLTVISPQEGPGAGPVANP